MLFPGSSLDTREAFWKRWLMGYARCNPGGAKQLAF